MHITMKYLNAGFTLVIKISNCKKAALEKRKYFDVCKLPLLKINVVDKSGFTEKNMLYTVSGLFMSWG